MKHKKGQIMIFMISFLIIFLLAFFSMRGIFIFTPFPTVYCEYKYGEDFIGGFAQDMPQGVYTCIRISENGDIKIYYFLEKDYSKNCKNPSYWNFLDWEGKCG